MHTKILQIRLRNDITQCIRHTSNTDLQGCSIHNIRNDQFRNLTINCSRLWHQHIRIRFMLSFHDIINIRNMDTLIITAANLRKILIDLYDHDICRAHDRCCHSGIDRIIKISMPIHR